MKKIVTLLTLLFMGVSSLFAAEDVIYLGYCDGQINTTGTGKSGACVVEGAIEIPQNKLEIFKGCEIKQIRVGLAQWYSQLRPDTITAWIRTSLDGENVAEGIITTLTPGEWNMIDLEETYTITGETTLYLGMSYYQKTKNNVMSITGIAVPGGCYIAKNGVWENYYEYNFGNLSLEGLVTGDNIPLHDLSLNICKASHMSVKHGEGIDITGTVQNNAAKTANGYKINYTINKSLSGEIVIPDTLKYTQKSDFAVSLPTANLVADEGIISVDIHITYNEAIEDQFDHDNHTSFEVVLYETAFERKVLMEQFTAEGCIACPGGGKRITEALDQGYHDDLVRIAHHAGYGSDWLSIEESLNDYIWFYGDPKLQSAPAYALNRHYNGNNSKDGYLIQSVGEAETIIESIEFELADPGFATVNIATEIIDHNIYVTVTGERLDILNLLCETPRLTVMVKENEIEPVRQMGAYDGYMHQHVLRQVVTDTWGDVITWNGNSYEAKYTIEIDTEWVGENIQIVAFIHAYNPKDIFNSMVFNAAETPVDHFAGVRGIASESAVVNSTYYTLQGVQLPTAPENDGLYIRLDRLENGQTVSNKTIIKK